MSAVTPTYVVDLPRHASKGRRGMGAAVSVAGSWVDAPEGPRGLLVCEDLDDEGATFRGDRDVLSFAPPLALVGDGGAECYTIALECLPQRSVGQHRRVARWMVATFGGGDGDTQDHDAHVCALHLDGKQALGVWQGDEWWPCRPECDLLAARPRLADGFLRVVAQGSSRGGQGRGVTQFFVDGARVGAADACVLNAIDGAGNVPLPARPDPSHRKQVFGKLRRLEVYAGALVPPKCCFRDVDALPPPPKRPKTAPPEAPPKLAKKRDVVDLTGDSDGETPARKKPKAPPPKKQVAVKVAEKKKPAAKVVKEKAPKDGAAHGDCAKVLRSRVLFAHGEEVAFLSAARASPRGGGLWVDYESRCPASGADLERLLRSRKRDCVFKFRPGAFDVGPLGTELEALARAEGGGAVMERLRSASQMSTLFAPSGGGDDKSWRDLDRSSNRVDFAQFAKAAARSDAAFAQKDDAALLASIDGGASSNKVTEWKPSFLVQPGSRRKLGTPQWFEDASWLTKLSEKCKREVFRPKLALMQAGALTSQHRDNYGTLTWIRVLGGQQLLATWSMADGDDVADRGLGDVVSGEGEHDDADFPWDAFVQLPTARLTLLDVGDFFLMKPGVYHRVFTLRPKVQLFGEFVSAATFDDALTSAFADAARPDCLKACEKNISMKDIFLAGVLTALAASDDAVLQRAHADVAALRGDAALAKLRWLPRDAARALDAATGLDVDATCLRLLRAPPGV